MTDTELRRLARRRVWMAITAIVLSLAVMALLMWRQQAATDAELAAVHDSLAAARERSDANANAAEALAEQLRELGEIPRVDPPESETVTVGPTREQVDAAVAAYLAANPPARGRPPRPAEIAAAVSNHLTANPPARGPAGPSPSPEMVAAAVRDYLTANPPPAGEPGQDGQDGHDGVDGQDGQDATPEMVAAAVRDYIEANPLPLCPAETAAEARTVLTTDGPTDVVICVVQTDTEEVPR